MQRPMEAAFHQRLLQRVLKLQQQVIAVRLMALVQPEELLEEGVETILQKVSN